MLKAIEFTKSGAYKEALKLCEKIKPKNLNNAVYFNVVGIVLRRLEFFDEAMKYSKRALQIDENMVAAKMNIATIELQKGKIEESIKS